MMLLPAFIGLLLMNTPVVDELWFAHYEWLYYVLSAVKSNHQFQAFVGAWKLPMFVVTAICWWQMEDEHEAVPIHFLLLPLVYVPFAIVCDILPFGPPPDFNVFGYPVVILPFGYIYVFSCTALVWLMTKLGLIIS
jgi:hypothetical protein